MKSNLYPRVSTLLLLLLACHAAAFSQQGIAIGDPTPKTNAVLYLKGNGTQGVIIPIVSTLGSFGESGMMVYNSTDKKVYYHDGTNWTALGGASADNIVGNEVSQVSNTGGLALTGSATSASPLTVGLIPGTTNGQILKWNSSTSKWELGTDNTGSGGLSTTLNSAQIYVGNASNTAAAVSLSGDAALSNTGVLTVSNSAITSAKIADATITNADVNASAAIAGTKITPNFGGQNITTTGAINGAGLSATGTVTFGALAGSGSRMVTADAAGMLSTQSIPSTFTTANVIPKGNASGLVASQIFDNGTAIGIGTTSPTYLLDISKDLGTATDTQIRTYNPSTNASSKSGIRFQTGNNWAVQLQTSQGDDWLQLTNNAGTPYHRWTLNAYYPGITSGYLQGLTSGLALLGGPVGIGTASPAQALDVIGNIKYSGNYLYFFDNKFIYHSSEYTVVNDHWIPNLGTSYDLGTSSFRWRTLYTNTNPNVSSDRRLKNTITSMGYGLNDVMKLRPVTYFLNGDAGNKRMLGLIAQEVQEVIPEVVIEDQSAQKMLGITYSDLIPVLINAMQEQQKVIEEQRNTIETMKSQLADHEARNEAQHTELQQLKADVSEIKKLLGTAVKSAN
jgi:hypothetical protein